MTNSRLKTIIGEYKGILIGDGMVTYDELKEMMSVDEELCTLCDYSEETLSKVCNIILRQAKGDRRINLERTHIDKVLEERMRLYIDGLSDVEIAKKQGVNVTTIYAWRKTRGLLSNPTISERVSAKRMEYYKQGMTDNEIADMTDSTYHAVRTWRQKKKLPVNKEGSNDRRTEKIS